MVNTIDLPMNSDGGHLVDPPIVDSLHRDEIHDAWIVSFVPEESISMREKEQVVVPFASSDGRRIRIGVQRIETFLGQPVDRVFHTGDGNFAFQTRQGKCVELSDAQGHLDWSLKAYIALQDIAMTAQIAFASSHVA